MLKTLLVIGLLLSSFLAQSGTLNCSSGSHRQESYGNGLYDIVELYCKDNKSHIQYDVVIDGYGLALRSELVGKSNIVCPGLSNQELEGEYFGLKLEVAAVLGLRGGLFYHSSSAFCMITGVDGGLGLSLVGATMRINKSH